MSPHYFCTASAKVPSVSPWIKVVFMELKIWHIYRGYYTAMRRYEFYLRVVKTIFHERAQRMSEILFSPREDKIHIFKPPCNVLFII